MRLLYQGVYAFQILDRPRAMSRLHLYVCFSLKNEISVRDDGGNPNYSGSVASGLKRQIG
jgi:hypothetical protein